MPPVGEGHRRHPQRLAAQAATQQLRQSATAL